MSLDIIGWKESAHVNIGYRRFKAFRCWCIGLMPLDFQLE